MQTEFDIACDSTIPDEEFQDLTHDIQEFLDKEHDEFQHPWDIFELSTVPSEEGHIYKVDFNRPVWLVPDWASQTMYFTCNCVSCQKLDIHQRKLKPFHALTNSDGATYINTSHVTLYNSFDL